MRATKFTALLVGFLLAAYTATGESFTYTVNGDGTATVTMYSGSGGDVVIPSTLGGRAVTGIAGRYLPPDNKVYMGAFANYVSITSVTIPSGVTNVGTQAFFHCVNLTAVRFRGDAPSGVGTQAFASVPAVAYYMPGASGWGTTFGGLPTATPWMISLTAVANPPEGGSVSGGGLHALGTNVQLLATAADGWVFARWGDWATNNPRSVTVPETNLTLTASFAVRFSYVTNLPDTNTITITQYGGCDRDLAIPDRIDGLQVTGIGYGAFYEKDNLVSVAIPEGVTNVGDYAFFACENLVGVSVPASVASIGVNAFGSCWNLVSIDVDDMNQSYGSVHGVLFGGGQTILIKCPSAGVAGSYSVPDSVTSICDNAFMVCTNLTSVTIGRGVASIGSMAFGYCTLTGMYFKGDAPVASEFSFVGATNFVAYRLPGTAGWEAPMGASVATVWRPHISGGLEASPDGFGFAISWASGMTVVVESSTDLTDPSWQPVQTNTLVGDTVSFSDPNWADNSHCFYRLVWRQ